MVTYTFSHFLTCLFSFKGQWKSKFNPNVTKDSDFIVNKDKTVKVKTMFIKANFRYAESKDLGAQVCSLTEIKIYFF